jgi:hypothetical protein
MSPPSDEDLLARQSALQEEARQVLAGLNMAAVVADAGPLLVTGSFVSGLMCWPEVDVMVHVGSDFSPGDVMCLLARMVSRPGVTGMDYRDERGPRCVTGQVRDERYHVLLIVAHAGRRWQIDVTLWLHDPHANVTRWHEELRGRITAEQRMEVLRIKDDWHRRPGLPASGRRCADLHRGPRRRGAHPRPVRCLARPAGPASDLAISPPAVHRLLGETPATARHKRHVRAFSV